MRFLLAVLPDRLRHLLFLRGHYAGKALEKLVVMTHIRFKVIHKNDQFNNYSASVR